MADDAKTAEGKKWAQDGCDKGQADGNAIMMMIAIITTIIDDGNVGDFDGDICFAHCLGWRQAI